MINIFIKPGYLPGLILVYGNVRARFAGIWNFFKNRKKKQIYKVRFFKKWIVLFSLLLLVYRYICNMILLFFFKPNNSNEKPYLQIYNLTRNEAIFSNFSRKKIFMQTQSKICLLAFCSFL